MNIPNYKWSALVAASLHGAFLVFYPTAPIVLPPPLVVEKTQPPQPVEESVQMKAEEQASDNPSAKPAGGPAVPDIPEEPPLPQKEQMVAVAPIYEHKTNVPVEKNLVDFKGGNSGEGAGVEGMKEQIHILKDLDRIPRATVQPSPRYPEELRKNGVKGSVTVEFDVDATGRVYRAEATQYTHREFVEPAVRAVLQWHFEPGRHLGRAVPFRMAVPLEFGTGSD